MSETICKSCGKRFQYVSIFEEITSCWKCTDDEIINLTHKENIMTKPATRTMTLPVDSKERKEYPLFRGVLRYFPAALAGVARTSFLGNEKHNPGEEMHHARSKSSDHADCVLRHLMDTQDLLAAYNKGDKSVTETQILEEISCACWRVLALSQELHEKFGAPTAPGAKE